MSETVTLYFELSILPENLDRLKEIWDRYVSHVEATEPGVLVYTWNVSEDNTKVCILEHYENTKAVLIHGENVAEFSAEMKPFRKVEKLSVFGKPSKELISVLKERYPTTYYEEYKGFTR